MTERLVRSFAKGSANGNDDLRKRTYISDIDSS
jgi:hypothetical protein